VESDTALLDVMRTVLAPRIHVRVAENRVAVNARVHRSILRNRRCQRAERHAVYGEVDP
jgi:hypothetical protein